MTTDFLVTRIRDGQEVLKAYDTKCEPDLDDPRTVEKLEIMRALPTGLQRCSSRLKPLHYWSARLLMAEADIRPWSVAAQIMEP
jgi:hypothetical protein